MKEICDVVHLSLDLFISRHSLISADTAGIGAIVTACSNRVHNNYFVDEILPVTGRKGEKHVPLPLRFLAVP